MIKSRIDAILKEYFYDYDSQNFQLGLLSGSVQMTNLHFNNAKINSIFRRDKIPLKLRKGILFNLRMEVSYLNLRLSLFRVDDLCMVFEPAPMQMSGTKKAYPYPDLSKIVKHLLANF